MTYKVAVVGATGNVGREILSILSERNFPVSEVVPLASKNSKGKKVSFGESQTLECQVLDDYDFTGTDIALFSPGSSVSKIYAPIAGESGCVVIDNTSCFRMDEDIPLVVPEVNPQAIADYKARNIISNPNCSTIQMLVAAKPLHDFANIQRIVVSTYQSVSGAGKNAMDELYNQTKGIFMNDKLPPVNFSRQIAFNVIPQIDVFLEDGSTKEEAKMVNETKKILDPNIQVSATCVRVPVFTGHAESINIQFEHSITPDEAKSILRESEGVVVINDSANDNFITPIECARDDAVFVSRVRQDPTVENGLNIWVVSDNLRKGAALNAVQIAEKLIQDFL